MGKKGGSRHLQRIAAPRSTGVARKITHWIIRPAPGPHPAAASVSLGVLLRETIGVVTNQREIKKALREGGVLVDGKVVRDLHRPVGLMDLVEIPSLGRRLRALVDRRGRVIVRDTDQKGKLCRIKSKKITPGGKLRIGLHDGRSLPAENAYKVGDSLLISLPDGKVQEHLKLEAGTRCLVIKGGHAGKIAVLQELIPGGATRTPQARMKSETEEFIAPAGYLFVIGDKLGE